MRCSQIGGNATVIEGDRVSVLFSYATPVAAHIQGRGYFRTATKHSVTTSRHINGWVQGSAEVLPQEWFNALDFSAETPRGADAVGAL